MAHLVTGAPAAPQGGRGRDRAACDADAPDIVRTVRVLDGDSPRLAGRALALDANVAAEVYADADRAVGAELVDDDVGREALADPSGVEAGTGGQPHCSRHDLDPGRVGSERARVDALSIASNDRSYPARSSAPSTVGSNQPWVRRQASSARSTSSTVSDETTTGVPA
jgi:hypothetical protein